MTTKKNKIIKDLEFPNIISGLLHAYHDKYLVDDSLSDLDVLLLCMYLIEFRNKKAGSNYEELKNLFVYLGRKENYFRVILHLAKKQNLIISNKQEKNIYFLVKGLKRIEKVIGQAGKLPVHIIKSGQKFSAIKLFEEFLLSEINNTEILLCDPHISASTLHPFSILKGKVKNIKILTANIYDSIKFNDYKKKFEKEINVVVEVKQNKKLHDRFMITGDNCWSIGSSLKDLGNKDTMIIELKDVSKSLREFFLQRWAEKP